MTSYQETIRDFISGKTIPLIGAEENRQNLAQYLVEKKGFDKGDIRLDMPLQFQIGEDTVTSNLDLVIILNCSPAVVLRCVAGSLGAAQREALAAARLVSDGPARMAVVSDGKDAIVMDVATGKITGKSLQDIPAKDEALKILEDRAPDKPDEKRLQKERLIFRTFDSDRINIQKPRT